MTLAIRLTHTFRGFDLQVDFTAPPGVTALFGRSGSGKTTVVNAVAGLLHPQAGRISVNNRVLLDTAARVNLPVHRRRIGYVFQDARLFPHLSVQQNLLYGRRFAAVGTGPSLDQITDFLGIEALLHRRTAALSGGEKQRVAIGRAILSNPDLLLMDEPLAALDDPRKTEILPYLERLRDDLGLPILYVSHSMAEVARLATTVVLMDAGRITAIGPTDALLSDPATAPLIGLREAGAVITARLTAREADGLSLLETSAGPLWLPRVSAPPGTTLRLRILAQDVILSRDRPTGLSALNILPGRILDIRTGDGPGALVRVQIGEDVLLARITRRSATALALTPGLPVHAILKAVSVPRENIGA